MWPFRDSPTSSIANDVPPSFVMPSLLKGKVRNNKHALAIMHAKRKKNRRHRRRLFGK